MKKIKLTKGYSTIVDDDIFLMLNKYSWHAVVCKNSVYAVSFINGKTTQMHRFILKVKKGYYVDHKNLNGLDNRRKNLRIATPSQNRMNTLVYKHNKTGYKGVHKCKSKINPYRSQIRFKGKIYHLGCFKTEKQAAYAYNKKAKELFKEFYRGNNVK